MKESYAIPDLPLAADLETVPILKELARASRALAELKGRAEAIPNQGILIDTLALQEARASSEIENIVTTQDELFQVDLFPDTASGSAKEVSRYRDTLKLGTSRLFETGLITNRTLIEMFQLLKERSDGFRTTMGTALLNDRTGTIVYVPPQSPDRIQRHMRDLEAYVNRNQDGEDTLDPLIAMAIIHHQFESIHPFPDGNGRIGRILNVLYLTKADLLDIPILYLSRSINRNKSDYYHLLQAVRDRGAWEEWVLFMLRSVTETAQATLQIVEGMREQMAATKAKIRAELPKIYSQDLLNNIFRHPYTRVDYVQKDLDVSRPTATKYLDALDDAQIVSKVSRGRYRYYVNVPLVALLTDVSESA